MKKKLSMILTVLMLILRLPVSAAAMPETEEVTIQTEIFSGFDITIPGSLAEKYRWSEGGYEGANWIHFYDRSQFDASGGKSSYEEADEEKGYLFSIRQYYYDGDYRYGMGDLMFYELFQPTRNEIVAFYSRDDLSRLMILSVEYADSAPVSVQKEALKIAGYMTPNTDIYLEDVDANPWNLKFANFLLNGRFRNMGQEYFDDAEIQACLYNVAGDDYPELIITNGAADGQSSQAYIYTFSENWQVEYLRTATEEELNAMLLQPFTAIRGGWGDFLEACGYQVAYLANEVKEVNAPGIPVSYAGATVDFKESLFEKSAYEYDNELAKLGAMLNKAACNGEQEICSLFYQMKIEDANIENYNYGGENAFSIAHRPMMLNGEEANLIFIVARGSQDPREYAGDRFMTANRSFLNQNAYNYVADFEAKILNEMRAYANEHEDLYDTGKPRVFFITGYSLGGAAANLTAAMVNNLESGNSWLSQDTDPTRIFAYTYGAIDSIDAKRPVASGYENIHNIYNYYDTFGPTGGLILTTNGRSGYGKFGHIDRFAYQFSRFDNALNAANHDISNYLTAIVEGKVLCNFVHSETIVDCPVDVEVLKNGEVVGRITDNQVNEELLAANPDVALMVVEDSKHIAVFNNQEAYSLRITATDDGEMSVSTVSFDETGEGYGAAEYLNVAIENGQVFSMDLPATDSVGSDTQTPELLIIDGDRISGKVNPDGSISPVNGTGNGLQIALPIAIAAIGGLIIFLGGRNMNETKQIKFPIAAVFSTLNVLIGLINIFVTYTTYTRIIGIPMSEVHRAVAGSILSLVPGILLSVVLFMRKRGPLLWITLGLELGIWLYSLCTFAFHFEFFLSVYNLIYMGIRIIPVVNWLLLLLFAVFQDRKDESGAAKLFQKIWFIPGILSVFNAFGGILGRGGANLLINIVSNLLVSIPMAFLLGWWLTHPYKKERPVYQMPIAQPYGQPVYQSVGAFDAAQKVICINCGRELLSDELFCAGCGTRRPEQLRAEPDHAEQKAFCTGCGKELSACEEFCSVCGKQRTMPAQGTQPVFQQPVYPQMGYVQDAPSGGMTALGFFFPIVGLILYLVWKDQTPLKAKSAGKGALIGVIVWTVLSVILAILAYVIPLLVFYSYY